MMDRVIIIGITLLGLFCFGFAVYEYHHGNTSVAIWNAFLGCVNGVNATCCCYCRDRT